LRKLRAEHTAEILAQRLHKYLLRARRITTSFVNVREFQKVLERSEAIFRDALRFIEEARKTHTHTGEKLDRFASTESGKES
jgi:hypothetical protein